MSSESDLVELAKRIERSSSISLAEQPERPGPIWFMPLNDAHQAAIVASLRAFPEIDRLRTERDDALALAAKLNGEVEAMRDALTASLPLLETLHSVIPLGDARRTILKAVKQVRVALLPTSQAGEEKCATIHTSAPTVTRAAVALPKKAIAPCVSAVALSPMPAIAEPK